jgi:hypothetical protein
MPQMEIGAKSYGIPKLPLPVGPNSWSELTILCLVCLSLVHPRGCQFGSCPKFLIIIKSSQSI